MKLRIGTRKSRLAVIQAELVEEAVRRQFPQVETELKFVTTKGDRMPDRPLDSFGGKGVFTKELEEELLAGEIDLAVHSAKDMPMELPEGLTFFPVLCREDPRDVLITRSGIPAGQLPRETVIGTSSLRRELQIKKQNPGVQIRMLRGNVQTRLKKLRNGEYDGIILAAAGLKRLGMAMPEDLHLEYFSPEDYLPAAGQGILAVEVLEKREDGLTEILRALTSEKLQAVLAAEREYLKLLGGSCNAPCGAYCRVEQDFLVMSAMYAPDKKTPRHQTARIRMSENPMEDGRKLAGILADRVRMQPEKKLSVSLVGAGPGDGGLVTRKGLECIRSADVIVYDALISGSLLNEARLDAEFIYAGKRSNKHHMRQEEINELLIRLAGEHKYVVRLKGGDPFVFGRGGEEAAALQKAGISFEVVPGVSSCYAVPAYGGIPLTERSLASSFHVITGHKGDHRQEDAVDYQVLAREEGTLVFLMGLGSLAEIAGRLLACKKAADTPAAVIGQGTTARQRRVVSDLEHIAEETENAGIETPAIVVVGEAAGFAGKLDWFGKKPLSGIRVLLTGTRSMVQEQQKVLCPLGVETVAVSLIECRPLYSQALRDRLCQLDGFTWLVFTSANGVEQFFSFLRQEGIDLRRLMHLKFAVIGKKTGEALEKHGFIRDFEPSAFTSGQLAAEWVPRLCKKDRVLLLRARESSPVLPNALGQAGIFFEDLALYETWVDVRRREELGRILPQVDYVTVASASAARALAALLGEGWSWDSDGPGVISIGPETTRAAEGLGIPVLATAEEYSSMGIMRAICRCSGREVFPEL